MAIRISSDTNLLRVDASAAGMNISIGGISFNNVTGLAYDDEKKECSFKYEPEGSCVWVVDKKPDALFPKKVVHISANHKCFFTSGTDECTIKDGDKYYDVRGLQLVSIENVNDDSGTRLTICESDDAIMYHILTSGRFVDSHILDTANVDIITKIYYGGRYDVHNMGDDYVILLNLPHKRMGTKYVIMSRKDYDYSISQIESIGSSNDDNMRYGIVQGGDSIFIGNVTKGCTSGYFSVIATSSILAMSVTYSAHELKISVLDGNDVIRYYLYNRLSAQLMNTIVEFILYEQTSRFVRKIFEDDDRTTWITLDIAQATKCNLKEHKIRYGKGRLFAPKDKKDKIVSERIYDDIFEFTRKLDKELTKSI